MSKRITPRTLVVVPESESSSLSASFDIKIPTTPTRATAKTITSKDK